MKELLIKLIKIISKEKHILEKIIKLMPDEEPLDYMKTDHNGVRKTGDTVRAYFKGSVTNIKKHLPLKSLNIINVYNGLREVEVSFSYSEYCEIFRSSFRDIVNSFRKTYEKYSRLSNTRKGEFNDTYKDTLMVIYDILHEHKDDLSNSAISKINKIIKEIDGFFENREAFTDTDIISRLDMEIEYLNKIRETRQMFEKMSNA